VVRLRIPGRQLVDQVAFVPLVIPGLVLGLALSFVYLRSPVPIYGTIFIPLIAYCTRYMPHGMRYAVTSMHQIASEGGVRTGQRRQLVADVPPGAAAVAGARPAGRMDLHPGRLVPGAFQLDPALRPGTEVLSILIFEQYENGQFTVLRRSASSWCSPRRPGHRRIQLGAKVGLRQD
jgi:iron(III) transport system permease protein